MSKNWFSRIFGKEDELDLEPVSEVEIDGEIHYVDDDTYEYIRELRCDNERLKIELGLIKNVLKSGDYDPPVSMNCADCRYVVISSWDGRTPIGCRKNLLCESFASKE